MHGYTTFGLGEEHLHLRVAWDEDIGREEKPWV